MLYGCGRRRFRHRFVEILITLVICLILLFIIRLDWRITTVSNRKDSHPRLFCVLINTHSTHERFVYMSNITWAKQCDKIEIIRYRRLQRSEDEANIPQSTYHVNLWTRILDVLRQSINSYEHISNNDLLIIVPTAIFVFREKLSLLFNNSRLPLIIIHEQQEGNAYILNGQAFHLVRNTELIDLCLQQSYPSARETNLWQCVKSSLYNEEIGRKCGNKHCFVQYHRDQLTLNHIKNGICLQNNRQICQSIALLYPVTVNDLLTLEYFKYRLKAKSSDDLL